MELVVPELARQLFDANRALSIAVTCVGIWSLKGLTSSGRFKSRECPPESLRHLFALMKLKSITA